MPLNKQQLIQQLSDFFSNNKKSPSEAANQIANIIDAYIKSGTVNVSGNGIIPPGTIITAGSPASQTNTNPVTSTVNAQGNII